MVITNKFMPVIAISCCQVRDSSFRASHFCLLFTIFNPPVFEQICHNFLKKNSFLYFISFYHYFNSFVCLYIFIFCFPVALLNHWSIYVYELLLLFFGHCSLMCTNFFERSTFIIICGYFEKTDEYITWNGLMFSHSCCFFSSYSFQCHKSNSSPASYSLVTRIIPLLTLTFFFI